MFNVRRPFGFVFFEGSFIRPPQLSKITRSRNEAWHRQHVQDFAEYFLRLNGEFDSTASCATSCFGTEVLREIGQQFRIVREREIRVVSIGLGLREPWQRRFFAQLRAIGQLVVGARLRQPWQRAGDPPVIKDNSIYFAFHISYVMVEDPPVMTYPRFREHLADLVETLPLKRELDIC